MDLLTYLQNYDPQKLVCLSSNTYCAHEHDSHNDSRWRWLSRGIEGRSMQDYFIKVKEIHFTEAVGIIAGQAAVQPPVQSVEEAGVKREQNTGFFEIEVQKEGEGEGNRADGNPATSV